LNIEDFLIKLKLKLLGKLRDTFDIVGKESAQWVGFIGGGIFFKPQMQEILSFE